MLHVWCRAALESYLVQRRSLGSVANCRKWALKTRVDRSLWTFGRMTLERSASLGSSHQQALLRRDTHTTDCVKGREAT